MTKEKQNVKTVEGELLRDLLELTSRQFVYEDGWCGMVPFDGELTELQSGPPVPFAELTWREQADVLLIHPLGPLSRPGLGRSVHHPAEHRRRQGAGTVA